MDFAPNEILLPIAVAPNYFALKFFSALARASLLLASRSQLTLHFQYSQPELEALGVIWALSLLRPYLLGKEFTIVTDAKSLLSIYDKQCNKRTEGRMTRWALRLAEFNYKLVHRAGKDNVVQDLTSRQPDPSTAGPPIEPLYAIMADHHQQSKRRAYLTLAAVTRGAKRARESANAPEGPKRHKAASPSRAPQVQDASRECKDDTSREIKLEAQRLRSSAAQSQDQLEHKAAGVRPDKKATHQAKLQHLHEERTLHDVANDLVTLLRKAYVKDSVAQRLSRVRAQDPSPLTAPHHVHRKKPLPPDHPHFLLDERGLVRYSVARPGHDLPLYVPSELRHSVLYAFHGLPLVGHLGSHKTMPLLRARFYWPGMHRDLKRWIKACLCCTRRKPSRAQRQGLSSPMERLPRPFACLHFDLVGPMPETEAGYSYILTAVCPFTQWPFALPIRDRQQGGRDSSARARADLHHGTTGTCVERPRPRLHGRSNEGSMQDSPYHPYQDFGLQPAVQRSGRTLPPLPHGLSHSSRA